MRAELIESDDPRWSQFLDETEHCPYERPGYARVCARVESGAVQGLYVQGEAGACLVPLILRDLPSWGDSALEGWRDATSPYGYPGALVTGSFPLEELQSSVMEELLSRRILSAFVRANPFSPPANRVLRSLGTVVPSGETVVVDLRKDEQVLWREIRTYHRRHITRHKESGYTTRVDDWTDLDAFKSLYAGTMERVDARRFYRFDDSYFAGLRAELGDSLHLISVVSPAGNVVSGGLYLCGSDGTTHSHLTGTSASELNSTKVLYDAAWRWARSRGDRALNLGGGLGRENDPLLYFKTGFSRSTLPFFTVRLVCHPDVYRQACAAACAEETSSTYFPAYRAPPGAKTEHRPPGSSEREAERVVEDTPADRQ